METPRCTLRALLPKLKQNSYPYLKDSLEHYRKTRKGWMTWQLLIQQRGRFIPSTLRVAIPTQRLATEETGFTCDMGTPIGQPAIPMNRKRRLIGSFNHGSMANALPDAIGAQAYYPWPPSYLNVGRRRFLDAHGDVITDSRNCR